MPRHNPALHRSQKAPMTPGRWRLLTIGAILPLVALGWALATVLRPAIQRTIVRQQGRMTASIVALPIAMRLC
jgi:hypothetical protein